MDAIEITLRRTAAASALAARYLAREEADCMAICGCGVQGRAQLAALLEVLPFKQALVWDLDSEKARMNSPGHACSASYRYHGVSGISDDATRQSDVIVTATTAHVPFLDASTW